MDGKNCWLRVVLCSTHAHTHAHTSWWIDITGNQIDLKRQWFIKRNGAYNMLWTTGPSPPQSARGRGCFRTEKKKAAMKRASEKRKKKKNSQCHTLWVYPLTYAARERSFIIGFPTAAPPASHTHTREHTQYGTDERRVYVFWKHFDVKICTVFDKPLRFSSIQLCDPRSLHRALLVIIFILLITLRHVYVYKREYMVTRINIVRPNRVS
jgi:hypothetical protein